MSQSIQALPQDSTSYAGFSRFEIELEFVQALASPLYLNHLAATTKLLEDDSFIEYINYLHSYWTRPEYVKYLTYPHATLKALELLLRPQFRKDIVKPDVVDKMWQEGIEGIKAKR